MRTASSEKSILNSPAQWLSNSFAGLLAGLVTVTYSLSYAALIFAEPISQGISIGIHSALLSATVLAIFVAIGSSFRFSIAGPDSNAAALLALMATSIVIAFPRGTPIAEMLPTIWLTIAISTVTTGAILALMGFLRLGRLIRFVPYPVVGGFLAGTGLLIVRGSFSVLGGLPADFNLAHPFFREQTLLWVPGVIIALLLLVALRRIKHFLVMPVILVVGGTLYFVVLQWMGYSSLHMRKMGLLFDVPTVSSNAGLAPFSYLNFSAIHWKIVFQQSVNMVAMMAVVFITILLNATGIELATMEEVDLDKDLRAAGFANIFAGVFGGMIGYLSISRSLLNKKAGSSSRIAGLLAGGVCGFFLFAGRPLLGFLPKAVLGGLLLYLGLQLLVEWLWDSRKKLSTFDYGLIWVILLSVAFWGFLPAVSFGVVISCLLFAFNYSRINVIKFEMSGDQHQSNRVRSLRYQEVLAQQGHQIQMLCLQGFLFFGTSNHLYEHVKARFEDEHDFVDLRYLILDFRLVRGIDSSAVLSFVKLRQLASRFNTELVFTNLRGETRRQLEESGCLEDNDGKVWDFTDLDHGLERCENKLLEIEDITMMDRVPLQFHLMERFEDPEVVSRLFGYMDVITLKFEEELFHQGECGDAMYFLEAGELSVVLDLPNGERKRLATIGAGSLVGEIAPYIGTERSATVVADLPSRLYRLSAEQRKRMQAEDPQLASNFHVFVVSLLAERLVRATSQIRLLFQ